MIFKQNRNVLTSFVKYSSLVCIFFQYNLYSLARNWGGAVSGTMFIYIFNKTSLFKYWYEIVQMCNFNIQLVTKKEIFSVFKEIFAQKIFLKYAFSFIKKSQ